MRAAALGASAGLFLSLAVGVWPETAARAQQSVSAVDAPFALETLRVPGRALEAWPARLEPAARERALVVVSVEGSPPDETRRLCVFARTADGSFGREAVVMIETAPGEVAFDIAPLAPGGPDALILLASDALRVVSLRAPREALRLAIDPPAPLPPRSRELGRLAFVADWSGDGAPRALVPDLDGGHLLPLGAGDPARLRFPVRAEYEPRTNGPRIRDELLLAELHWPALERADDDGDGRPDLFVMSRFSVGVHRLGPAGLAERASRTLPMRPFSVEEELRPRTTSLRLFARDLDGDGLADLVVHRTAGTLLRSHSLTEVFLNPGGGVRDLGTPSLRLAEPDGLVTLEPLDLDRDGRMELVQARLGFGVLQLARILTTRRAEVDLRVTPIRPAALAGVASPAPSFERPISLRLDFGAGRVLGLLPTAEGDWNGDGRQDLVYGRGDDELVLQLGSAEPSGPGFGGAVITQAAPSEGLGRVADLDGDGLDDLVLVDPRDASGAVRVLRNRGRLAGTPPALRAPAP